MEKGEPFEFINTGRGKAYLAMDRYLYVESKQHRNTKHFKCYTRSCSKKVNLKKLNDIWTFKGADVVHPHERHDGDILRLRFLDFVKTEVAGKVDTPIRKVYEKGMAKFAPTQELLAHIPSLESLASTLYQRRGVQKKRPRPSPSENGVTIIRCELNPEHVIEVDGFDETLADITIPQYIDPELEAATRSLEQSSTLDESNIINLIDPVKKRMNYLTWEEYFMSLAFLNAQRSKDPSTQVGACIVNEENKVVANGYNGLPMGCSDDEYPWEREGPFLETKYAYICHAEMNAIMNKNSADLKNCSLYVTLFPCNECAKLIIQSGIKHVIYCGDKYRDKDQFVASRRMLSSAGVAFREYAGKQRQIVINFEA
ncbi:Deoxycytidylate deaminase [Halotydeus destructor]|nr:Deoxycytidylate deaminase [Halotydeus destructor]